LEGVRGGGGSLTLPTPLATSGVVIDSRNGDRYEYPVPYVCIYASGISFETGRGSVGAGFVLYKWVIRNGEFSFPNKGNDECMVGSANRA
jgi:hypothetical protein